MSRSYELKLFDRHNLQYTLEFSGNIELGRQSRSDEKLFNPKLEPAGFTRVVIAKLEEQTVSRQHVYLEPQEDGKFNLTNRSTSQPIHVMGGEEVKARSGPVVITAPVLLQLGSKTIRVQESVPTESGTSEDLYSLPSATRAPGMATDGGKLATISFKSSSGVDLEEVLLLMQKTMDLLQCAAGSMDFFQKACQSAVELVGLDWAAVYLLDKAGEWEKTGLHLASGTSPSGERQPSHRILGKVRNEKRTFWQTQPQSANEGGSLANIQGFVAAPVLHRLGHVIGVLYGSRQMGVKSTSSTPITKFEAMMVELLGSSVAAGLARLEQEQAAIAATTRLEQFFTPELARQIAARPDLLQGRDAEVTLLFCDIRDFSRFSEKLGPSRTVEWISDVMEELSDAVLEHHGVVVDYIGDEILAMWGAPEAKPNHAQMAVKAAVSMLERLPKLNERWMPVLEEPMDFGIGINTGVARVGNIGTKRKLKYGALGNSVNLASRVQGANKYFKTRLLITGWTRQQLDQTFELRRLCRVRVVHIHEPVELFEVVQAGIPNWAPLKEQYETALAEFERKEFRQAARTLGDLVRSHISDGPSLVLLARTVNFMVQEQTATDTVWELPGK